jgi:hypothetical protein
VTGIEKSESDMGNLPILLALGEEYTDRVYTPNNVFRLHSPRSIDFLPLKGQYSSANLNEQVNTLREDLTVEITKALAALQPLYGKDNVEIITIDGRRVRGTVRSMKTTQALTTPSVKMECANGQIIKIPFPTIAEIKDHNLAS